jgi:hypothetical protein
VVFEVRRDDFHRARFDEAPPPELGEGEALLEVSAFGLTTDNITYLVLGDAMSYWKFFPAPDGWGRMPVWGFADVAASEHRDVEAGKRVYGYLPAGSHLVVRPDRVDGEGFVDATPHRTELPPIYNHYAFTDADPGYEADREPEQMLLRPLFGTAFLLDDQLAEEGFGGANTVVVSSASSKTALATAFLIGRRDGPELVGLTSRSRVEFCQSTGAYGRVLAYDDVASLGEGPAVLLEFAGNAEVRSAVHRHFGEGLVRSTLIGMTHHDRLEGGGAELPGAEPTFFFAPDQAIKRSAEWGGAGLRGRIAQAWTPFVEWTGGWLRIERIDGPAAFERTYLQMLDRKSVV